MVANILPAERPHPLTLGLGSKGVISTFSEHGHVAYQIKWNHEMQQHGSKYFARRPLSTSIGDRVNRSKFNFFRTWSFAYKTIWNHEMQQHGSKYFARRPSSRTPWGRSQKVKIQIFQTCCISN